MTVSAPGFVWLGPDAPDAGITPDLVGAKAAGLWRMGRLGLRIPPAFALPTSLCAGVNAGAADEADIAQALRAGVARLEAATGRGFGDHRAPLLVSVRSGAAKSMPGMLSTVLNVGLNPRTVHGLIRLTGDPRLAWDSYRRFFESYAVVVGEASPAIFARRLAEMIAAEQARDETELDGEALERLAFGYGDIVLGRGAAPEDPMDQLTAAALAVFRSWEGAKAREYRRMNGLEGLAGTAVTVQAMVFGNAGPSSGSGVAFSRDPATGEKGLYLDFLFDAQGEDVVSGRRTPVGADALAARLPEVHAALERGVMSLEAEAGDVQDVEFTVESGELYFLQTRAAKRTPRALLKSTVDLVREGRLDAATGLARLAGLDMAQASVTRFAQPAPVLARGVAASFGVVSGRAAFDTASAKALAADGGPVVLVRNEPSTEDIEGFGVAQGLLTAVGGRTSHAAVVARQLGRVCVVGCEALGIDPRAAGAMIAGQVLKPGDWISLDGAAGEVTLGRRDIITETPQAELTEIAAWRAEAEAGLSPATIAS